jgi:DNA-binding NtrC family response regulator
MIEVDGLLGNSQSINSLKEKINNVIHLDVPILLMGEAGSGKDFIVNLINSKNDLPLLKFHSEDLISELNLSPKKFSKKQSKSLTFKAEDISIENPIYFDKLELLSTEAQSVLFRIIEKNEFVSEKKETIRFEGRFFFSASPAMLEKVKEGVFRKDLFQKIQLVRLNVPTLKERKQDIPFLVNQFVTEFNLKYKKKISKLSDKLIQFFQIHDYPNNIFELKTLIEGMIVLCSDKVLDISHVPKDFLTVSANSRINKYKIVAGIKLSEYEKEIIIQNLRMTNNNREKAAKLLGISVRTLYRKLIEYDIQ